MLYAVVAAVKLTKKIMSYLAQCAKENNNPPTSSPSSPIINNHSTSSIAATALLPVTTNTSNGSNGSRNKRPATQLSPAPSHEPTTTTQSKQQSFMRTQHIVLLQTQLNESKEYYKREIKSLHLQLKEKTDSNNEYRLR